MKCTLFLRTVGRAGEVPVGGADDGDPGWGYVPGKGDHREICERLDLGKPIVLQNSLIKELAGAPSLVPTDLASVIRTILALSNT